MRKKAAASNSIAGRIHVSGHAIIMQLSSLHGWKYEALLSVGGEMWPAIDVAALERIGVGVASRQGLNRRLRVCALEVEL